MTTHRLDRITPRPISTANTRLHGSWLWAARLAWGLVTLLIVIMYALSIPHRINDFSVPCAADPCMTVQLTPEGAQMLENTLGITPLTYALMVIGAETYITLGFFVSGMVIAWRKSDDWMALFTSAVLIMASVGLLAFLDTLRLHIPAFTLLTVFVQSVIYPLLVLLFYLFPDGSFKPAWLRWPALITTAITTFIAFYYGLFSALGLVFLSLVLAGGLFSQVYRYRNISSPTERQQTKWVIVGFTGMFLAFAINGLTFAVLGVQPDPSEPYTVRTLLDFIILLPFALVFLFFPSSLVPITFAISTLRFRLWDVDPILNRSLVYGGLTLFLGIVFAAGFFGLRAIIELIFGEDQVVIAAALAGGIIVALFNPARRRLRSLVDRRIYHINIDYQKAEPQAAAPNGNLRTRLGPFADLEPIGRGGMAEVYKTIHPTLSKPVAVKVLPAGLAQEPDFRKRFEREAKVVAALKHPNIVQVFDYGESDGTAYMVMEFIGGRDLAEEMRAREPLSLKRTAAILGDVARALDYAHAQGLVHRDIKPSNVMLDGERAVLMDFGIARLIAGGTRLTASGMIGTLDYMAPEQIQDATDVDGRADVYALGVMTYQMLTGSLPFHKSSAAALLIAHLNQPAPDPRTLRPDLPAAAAHAVLKALEKHPTHRYASAGQFIDALADDD